MLISPVDFRTFYGAAKIEQFLSDRLASAEVQRLKLKDDYVGLMQPYEDLAWIQAMFEFETGVGIGSGVFRLVPLGDSGEWKAHCMFTNLEDLKGFPEMINDLRNTAPNHGKWAEDRRRSSEFAGEEPTCLIIGAGQSGLELAARLKCLQVRTLVVEKNERIGDNWRNRYEALCLHDPVCEYGIMFFAGYLNRFCNMQGMIICLIFRAYIRTLVSSRGVANDARSFPPTWPVYTPALKVNMSGADAEPHLNPSY